jgi:murein L,D-transpeptidase YafK
MKKLVSIALLALFALSLGFCVVAGASQSPAGTVDRVVVYKSKRRLILLSGGKRLRSYRVALGGSPVGPKRREGDHRTPEGHYMLDARNEQSHYYKAFHISYPNAQDAAKAKEMGVSPGGDIMLHALPKEYSWAGKMQALYDWTDGCIAISDEEMDELWTLIKVPTPIDIYP